MSSSVLERYRSFVDDWSAFTAASSRPEPTVFRVRAGRVDEQSLLDRLTRSGHRTRPVDGIPGFHQVESGPVPLSMTIEHWLGLVYVQQASTGVAAPALAPAPGERVLDLCAAPGGKTLHMAELMADTGCLVANEISEGRIRGLLGNVYRMGHPGVMVVASDGRAFPGGARFDRVLVDAPCSGEGTLRRRGGEPPEPSASFLSHLGRVQRALLARAIELTRPGGTVLYVTCTFAPEENEAVVSDALERLPVELEPLELGLPHARGLTQWDGARYDARLEGAARIYPHHLDSGGLFLAKLRRLDGGEDDRGGWSAVPEHFPEWPPDAAPGAPRAARGRDASHVRAVDADLLRGGIEEVARRFGIQRDLGASGWIVRGGRAWMHTLQTWPLPAWSAGDWRPISVGIRAIEFDSKRRARPTNDLLRLLGRDVTERVIDLEADALDALLERQPVPTSLEARGPYALRYAGDVVGRGAVTAEGLKSEIPRARAADLRRLRERAVEAAGA